MKKIKRISNDIEELIEKAQCFAKTAVEMKEEEPALAEAYVKAANELLNIMDTFHTQVVNIIGEYKKTKGDIPKEMKILYDIFHEKHIADTITAKSIIALYNGGR